MSWANGICTSHNFGKLFLTLVNRFLQSKPPAQESSKSQSVPDKISWYWIAKIHFRAAHRCCRFSRCVTWCDNHGATILETRPLARQHNRLQPKLLIQTH